jgi:hypothetical protein
MSSILPANWSTISLHLTTDRDNLILVRHRRESEPIVFKLPLDRLARREGEDESFTYDNAINELNDIIASTKVNSQNAKNVKTREEREAWWQERQELDTRLKDLLQMVEDNWLGAFKVSLRSPPSSRTTAHYSCVLYRASSATQDRTLPKVSHRSKLGSSESSNEESFGLRTIRSRLVSSLTMQSSNASLVCRRRVGRKIWKTFSSS